MPPGGGGAVAYGGSDHGISLPTQTLYINNLNDKISKEILRRELYVLCSQFGSILDVVALKTPKMRGQAFVVFQDLRATSTALSKLQDFEFYGKRMKTAYSKSKSDAVAKEEGTFVPKHKRKAGEGNTVQKGPKKISTGAAPGAAPAPAGAAAPAASSAAAPADASAPPEPAANLPAEITEDMLNKLFVQFPGLSETRMVPGKPGIAFVEFGNEVQAGQAKDTLQGFKLTPKNLMRISYAKKT